MSKKPAGWYYVGDGQLRYRDDYGWTEFVMDTNDPRARSWPPPTPRTMLQQVRDHEAQLAMLTANNRHRRMRWFRRREARPS